MSDVDQGLLIAVLVVVCILLLFQLELYRNILAIMVYYSPEAPPPSELRTSTSFLNNDSYQKKQNSS